MMRCKHEFRVARLFLRSPYRCIHETFHQLQARRGTQAGGTGTGDNIRASCKQAFSELQSQVKKHQSRLRKDYEWKRKRPRSPVAAVS